MRKRTPRQTATVTAESPKEALKSALMSELKSAILVAQIAISAGESAVATDALDRAYLLAVHNGSQMEKPKAQQHRKPRQRKKATSQKRTRVPTERSRASVMEVLGKTEGTMTVDQLAKATGLTPSAVKRGVSSIDGDLLQVVQERRTDPAQYSLKSMREEVLA